MKTKILNLDNKAAGDVELNDAIFGLEPRADLIQRVVVWQLAKRRAGTHKILTRAEIEGVGFKWADLAATTRRYDPARLRDGWNTLPDGELIFYISNPALGLWAYRGRFSV